MSIQDAVLMGSCPQVPPSKVDSLNQMIDAAREITLETFRRKVNREEFEVFQRRLQYSVGAEPGLHIKDDFAVRFYTSKVRGVPVAFVTWSAMEFVFASPKDSSSVLNSMF